MTATLIIHQKQYILQSAGALWCGSSKRNKLLIHKKKGTLVNAIHLLGAIGKLCILLALALRAVPVVLDGS